MLKCAVTTKDGEIVPVQTQGATRCQSDASGAFQCWGGYVMSCAEHKTVLGAKVPADATWGPVPKL